MRFVITDRTGGKTTAAVAWLKEDPQHRVLLTSNESQAQYLRREHGLKDSQVMCWARARSLHGRKVTVAVDDAELVLAAALGLGTSAEIDLVTATGETG